MSSFTIDASCDGRALTLACRGELDAGSCAVLREAIAAHAATGAACVVLDLSALEFIDSSGIATVVKAAQQLAGGTAPDLALGPCRVRHPGIRGDGPPMGGSGRRA